MWFDSKRASAVTANEVLDLVASRPREDAMIDFKREFYRPADEEKMEMLRDVAAFANADGGYIVFGVEEAGHRATGKLNHIPEAENKAKHVRDLCLQHISPRVRDLEAVPLRIDTETELLIVHVPESSARPHMVTFDNTTHFCRRYQDVRRPMSMEDLTASFRQRFQDTEFGFGEDMGRKINELVRLLRHQRIAELQPTDSVGNAENAEEIIRIMELRFREAVGDKPYVRMVSIPDDASATDLAAYAAEIEPILRRPPETRRGGWTIWAPAEIKRGTEGWTGPGPGERCLTLLTHGYLEFYVTCADEMFQWGRLQSSDPTLELYPLAVCELPVNFTRLASLIYRTANVRCDVRFKTEFVNIQGFRLRPGVPSSFAHMMPGRSNVYSSADLATRTVQVQSDFAPDPVAFRMVEDVYSAFGIAREHIPYFRQGTEFDVDSNSAL